MNPGVRLILAVVALTIVALAPNRQLRAAQSCVGCFENSIRVYAGCIEQGGGDWGCSGAMCTYIQTRCNLQGCGYNCP